MQQILQSLSDGQTLLAEVPAGRATAGRLLIRTTRSLISAGTERMLVEFGRANWLDKARQQPEKVRQVLSKIKTDGLLPTVDAIRSKLDQPLQLGYCNVGVVVEVGEGIQGFAVGDRVVSNGAHAEMVCVPRNLCARIPDAVSDDQAAFVVLGAIGLQGLRLVAPTLGERFVVIGLGLIGLLVVQLLRANGCRVLGIDPDATKAALAAGFGADVVALEKGEDPVAVAALWSKGRGVDGVLIAATTTSNEPVRQAAQMCRKRGRIVLVGTSGLELQRSDFYEKELVLQVSCSYGPGRYDPEYEGKGHDYPIGFVRWTEQRNFEAVLDMLEARSLDVQPLITHRFALQEAPAAYQLLADGSEPHLGILLDYPAGSTSVAATKIQCTPATHRAKLGASPSVGFIGAGNYAGRILIPAFRSAGAGLAAIASQAGVSAAYYGRKYGFAIATTDAEALLKASDVDALVIATRHDTHARFVQAALSAGKHVFVEKPLALTLAEVQAIEDTWAEQPADRRSVLMVGFNRRFAVHVGRIKELLTGVREPKCFMVRVNAGAIPATHWTQDQAVGGGRIVGEACHFVDLLRFLAGHPITEATVRVLGRTAEQTGSGDNATILLRFADGSMGTIEYLANGHVALPKERLEIFCAGKTLLLDNFRRMRGHGWTGFRSMNLWRQDKGQVACASAFVSAIRDGLPAPIPVAELLEVSRVVIQLAEAARH
jgi:predicted dehydrogenase/threonine dehydrogenase-like Zn-dependent dehydrogenase